MPDSAEPLLVVTGRFRGWPSAESRLNRVILLALIAIAVGAVAFGALPWLGSRSLGESILIGLATVLAPVTVLAIYVAPRSGVVRFHDDKIVVERELAEKTVDTYAWTDVASFDDGSEDYVDLVLVKLLSPHVHVPTPDEGVRTRVLELLVARGVPRR